MRGTGIDTRVLQKVFHFDAQYSSLRTILAHSNVHSPTGSYTFGLQKAKFTCPKRDSNPRRLASSYAKSSQIFLCFGISLLDQFKKKFPKKFFGLIFARNAQKNGFRGLFIKIFHQKSAPPSATCQKSGPLSKSPATPCP